MPLTSQVGRDQVISSTRAALLAGGDRQADGAEERRWVEVERVPLLAQRLGQLGHAVVEARERDAAVGVAQVGQDAGEDVVGVGRGRAVEARMQVAVGGR